MAAAQSTGRRRARPDELVVDDRLEWCIRYEGTQDVLTARAGIPAEWFDTSRWRTKNTHNFVDGERRHGIRRASAGSSRFVVFFGRTEAERDRVRARNEAERKAAEARRLAEVIESGWPTDAAAWRARAERSADLPILLLGNLVSGAAMPGFRFAPDVIDEIGVHVQMIRGLIETGAIVADPAARAAAEAKHRAKIHAADPAFSGFLGTLQRPVSGPDGEADGQVGDGSSRL